MTNIAPVSATPIVQCEQEICEEQDVVPFLRWVGGKRRLSAHLMGLVPGDYQVRQYVEPFLGAGSLFFALKPAQAVVSDFNKHLIECYIEVRERPDKVGRYLAGHLRQHSSEHYYRTRADYNRR